MKPISKAAANDYANKAKTVPAGAKSNGAKQLCVAPKEREESAFKAVEKQTVRA